MNRPNDPHLMTKNLGMILLLLTSLTTGAAAQAPPVAAPVDEVAQEVAWLPGRFLLGANLARVVTPNDDIGGQWKVGGFFAFRPRPGWGPAFGLSWFRSDLRIPTNDGSRSIGTVRVRPLMGGIGYTIERGRVFLRFSGVGGYAFTKVTLDEVAPGLDLDARLKETWVIQPSIDLYYAVARRLAIGASVDYTIARPELQVTVSDGVGPEVRETRRLRSDYLALVIGLGVSLF